MLTDAQKNKLQLLANQLLDAKVAYEKKLLSEPEFVVIASLYLFNAINCDLIKV